MTDPFPILNPLLIFTSCGWIGVLVLFSSIFLTLSAIVIALRKIPAGDVLITGCIRLQFLVLLYWFNCNTLYSYFCLGWHTGEAMLATWLCEQSSSIMGGVYQFALLAISVIAGKLSYKTNLALTAWDVAGLTAATISVALNFLVKNVLCIFTK